MCCVKSLGLKQLGRFNWIICVAVILTPVPWYLRYDTVFFKILVREAATLDYTEIEKIDGILHDDCQSYVEIYSL